MGNYTRLVNVKRLWWRKGCRGGSYGKIPECCCITVGLSIARSTEQGMPGSYRLRS
jgi:hypothetical protein